MTAASPACAVALKEWAILCHALATGRQSWLLRKGGILDRARPAAQSARPIDTGSFAQSGGLSPPWPTKAGFRVEQRAFFLFPTYFHEKRADVIAEAHADFDALAAAAPPPTEARLAVYAEIEEARFVDDRAALHRLAPHQLYTPACVDARFDYRERGLWVVLLRAFTLPAPHHVAVSAEQAGCVSWVHLDAPFSTAGAQPVLSGEEMAARSRFLAGALCPAGER